MTRIQQRRSLNRAWRRIAEVAQVPATATNSSQRQTVVSSLRCTHVQAMEDQDKERARMGDVVRAYVVYTEPANGIATNMRFLLDGDYRIHAVTPHPAGRPIYLEIHLEEEA
ncbi:MAG: hypothetical protein IPM39_24905 [Chloroflexi bacterium]|nr:hypothetical protein [Chloroflexota bacterium]